ncbi:hypothetical protein PTW37_03430 [Arthrobacter agilis]|uniref:hypothetical protein n=1 Tax=Arthrobacter agilis TaxID=37921 RepID=UPI0023657604|nr:hypothetical protein [Arthrobacter agilis]WDF33991.1 hypothetical protein PTW37_03430 [Arthrobacter agilis]
MDPADAVPEDGLHRRLTEISHEEQSDPSRAALSAKDLALYIAVTLGITVIGFLVLAL